jgi:hypothetical protein
MPTWEQLPIQPWNTEVTGLPDRISVGSRQNIWGVNSVTRSVYQWRERQGIWRRSSDMSSSIIAAAADRSVWCVGSDFFLYSYADDKWTKTDIQAINVIQLAARSASELWSISQGQAHFFVATYDFKEKRWQGKGSDMRWVSVATDGTVWCVTHRGGIVRYDPIEDDWISVDSPRGVTFAQVSVVHQGLAWALSTDGTLRHFEDHWYIQADRYTTVSAGSDETGWAINSAKQICNYRRCPPTNISILELAVSSDSIANYETLEANAANRWGMTGLMTISTVPGTECYGDIPPGTVFLVPGITLNTGEETPTYEGWENLRLNCQMIKPLVFYRDDTSNPNNPTLHLHVCNILQLNPKYFIGFSVAYPWNGANSVAYHSGTCNVYWFGTRDIPDCNCGGISWCTQIMMALANSLSSLT